MILDMASINPKTGSDTGRLGETATDSEQAGLFAALFNTELGEQLALLQENPLDLMPLQQQLQGMDLAGLQEFASVNGIQLPQLSQDDSIDLQETFQVLSDILNNIEVNSEPVEEFIQPQVLAASVALPPQDNAVDNVVDEAKQGLLIKPDHAELTAELSLAADKPLEQSKIAASSADKIMLPNAANQHSDSMQELDEQQGELFSENLMPSNQENVDQDSAELFQENGETFVEVKEQTSVDVGKNSFRTVADLALQERVPAQLKSSELAPMNRQLADPDWGDELANRLVFMHKQAIPAAQLNLNPKHLGPVSIRVDVDNDNTSIAFSVQHGVVKEAIEAALPKLKDMLGGQQLNLVDVNVSQQQSEQKSSTPYSMGSGQQGNGQQPDTEENQAASEQEVSIVDEIEAGRAIAQQGVLSIFA